MYNNYYFLRQLSHALKDKLIGFVAVSCFSQNKEELIIELNNERESFFIKAHLLSAFSCLSFPPQFSRARKNSVELFAEIILKKVTGVTQFENERSFAIDFEKGYSLLFKMHANRSNVLLTKNDETIRIFRNQFKSDLDTKPSTLHRTIDWSKTYFLANVDELKQAYFTFGKDIWSYLNHKGFENLSRDAQWELLNDTLQHLANPTYYIVNRDGKTRFTLLPQDEIVDSFENPIEAINEFFYRFTSTSTLDKEKADIRKHLTSSIESCRSYIVKNEQKLKEITQDTLYKTWADILMANLYQIEKGANNVTLPDFNNQPITIKLKPELSPQKNAEIFYRKAKNQEIEIKKLTESITKKKTDLATFTTQLQQLERVQTVKELKAAFNTKATNVEKENILPFHQVEHNGFQIWIGKNAVNNDLLTLKYAHKDDLWLHAKDVSGSHVVIKHQSGKPFPKDVIERAAELAAYNSKRKTDSLCPVVYTPKKFVRKRKGDPAGSVIVEREEVIMVTPAL